MWCELDSDRSRIFLAADEFEQFSIFCVTSKFHFLTVVEMFSVIKHFYRISTQPRVHFSHTTFLDFLLWLLSAPICLFRFIFTSFLNLFGFILTRNFRNANQQMFLLNVSLLLYSNFRRQPAATPVSWTTWFSRARARDVVEMTKTSAFRLRRTEAATIW